MHRLKGGLHQRTVGWLAGRARGDARGAAGGGRAGAGGGHEGRTGWGACISAAAACITAADERRSDPAWRERAVMHGVAAARGRIIRAARRITRGARNARVPTKWVDGARNEGRAAGCWRCIIREGSCINGTPRARVVAGGWVGGRRVEMMFHIIILGMARWIASEPEGGAAGERGKVGPWRNPTPTSAGTPPGRYCGGCCGTASG